MRKGRIRFEDRLGLFQENKTYYLLLLIALVSLIGIYPLMTTNGITRLPLTLFLITTMLTGALVLSNNRLNQVVSLFSGSLMLIAGTINDYLHPAESLVALSYLAGAIFFLHVSLVLIYDIFSYRKKVAAGLLYGAISVYLLIGISFAFSFSLIELIHPNSFRGAFEEAGFTSTFSSMLYFSFITLTTLGYGDISPLTRQAIVLSYLEAICGQMYLTILVPRLVGMYISRDSE